MDEKKLPAVAGLIVSTLAALALFLGLFRLCL